MSERNLLILDLETYYNKEYSLRKMSTPAYVLDQRFELQMAAVKLNDEPHKIVDGPDLPAFLASVDPAITTSVTFNALFDQSVLAWRYGWVPSTMIDAMGMARALLGHELQHGVSLKAVADHLGLPAKGNALASVIGMRREEIIGRGLWPAFCDYALHDNELCESIFLKLYPQFPWSERRLMDMVLRCCVEPRFLCDVKMLEAHLIDVQDAKAELLRDANNIDPKIIMSTTKFKEALEARGVEVEMKVSPTTGLETPCFAKTDAFMETLQEHPDSVVAAMAAARLGLKSTLEESRTMKMLSIAQLPWPDWILK
jgi:DNA polymerase